MLQYRRTGLVKDLLIEGIRAFSKLSFKLVTKVTSNFDLHFKINLESFQKLFYVQLRRRKFAVLIYLNFVRAILKD